MTLRVLAILAAFAALGVVLPVRAQDQDSASPPGLAYASLFYPVPSGTPINVRPWDNTAENQRVRLSFTEALNRRGVHLTDGRTPLTLNFETEVESLAAQGRNADSRVRVNLGSALDDLHGDGGSGTTRYVLRATLDDQDSGQRLWQGEATYTGAVVDEAATFSAMAPVLVDGFGQNLQPKGFRIR